MEITKEETDKLSREIDAHDESLKASIEGGSCPKCGRPYSVELLPRAIRFYCNPGCLWSAIYPIRTLGNSERAERDDALDLIAISEREVIAKAKAWSMAWQVDGGPQTQSRRELDDAGTELLAAVTLLESREALPDEAKLQQAMKDTEHLEEIRK